MEKSGDFERYILEFAGEAVKNNCSMTYAMWKDGGKKGTSF